MSYRIIGTGSALPEKIVTNDELAEIVDTNDEWIFTRTGIHSRHVCANESANDLAVIAVKNALEDADVNASDLDMIICSTMRGDTITPAAACLVAESIGAHCPCFDINNACTGFIYALDIAAGFYAMDRVKKVLIVTVEIMSKLTDWKDRASCVLFGDGAGAVVLDCGQSVLASNIDCSPNSKFIFANANGYSPFSNVEPKKEGVYMNGPEVYKFAVSAMISEIEKVCLQAKIDLSEIDYVLPHQANVRIMDNAMKKLNLPNEKVLKNIVGCGNMSSTSIVVLMDECNRKKVFKRGDKLLLVAFGAGLCFGATIIRWEK